MSIAKISKIIKTDVYNGTSKTTGRAYTITTCLCDCTIDGVHDAAAEIKAMGKAVEKITVGAEIEVSRKEWQGKVQWEVASTPAASGGGGWQKKPYTPAPKISWADYEKLCTASAALAKKLFPDHAVQAFDKIIGCATVVIDFSGAAKKPAEQHAEVKTEPAKIMPATAANTLKIDSIDPYDDILSDELYLGIDDGKPS